MRKYSTRKQLAILALLALSGCGGGGGGGDGGGGDGNGGTSAMTMACAEGAGYQCSGSEIRARDNGIVLTDSGVQVYGKSTNDPVEGDQVSGLTLASKGQADIRVRKSNGDVSNPVLLLNNLEIYWNGRNERPRIIETFNPDAGRNVLNPNGTVSSVSLPSVDDLGFYDYATKGTSATQENYANNRYFPRDEPVRCDSGDCQSIETTGITNDTSGDLNHASAVRRHGDGDIHAGNDENGEPLPGGSGPGVPFAGSKGYRALENWSYQYANLAAWLTHDTVEIAEWRTTSGVEHNQNRRGMIAYGDVSARVPSSGTATYSGTVYGWYEPGVSADTNVSGTATITVDFASREVTATIEGIPTGTFTVSASLGTDSRANYLTGAADGGGLSARLFGPSSDSAPPELAGVFSLPGDSAVIGGFIARRQ